MDASSRSMNSNADYPSGRKPRSSAVMEGDYPDGRRPRGSIVVEEDVIVEDKLVEEIDEHREKRRRKRIAMLAACILTIILVIIIIFILVSVLGTGDGPSNVPIGGIPDNCVANNETKPETYDEYVCDLITTLTTRESTYLRNYAPNTPYGMSIGWMIKEDGTDFENTPREYIMERFVMTLFYFATGGKDWFSRFAFLTQDHVCDWTGDSKDAVRCAYAQDKVTDLGFPQNGLEGPIPTELGFLTELTRLYFSINSLSGNIPTELFQLTKLELLYLDRNNLRGKIPTEINLLTDLETLHLSNNDFNGDLTELCNMTNTTGPFADFHADCNTGRVTCECCESCL